MKRSIYLALLLAASAILAAHDLYLMPDVFSVKPGQRLIFGIHDGDAFPQSEESPIISRLRDTKLAGVPATNIRGQKNRAVGEVAVKTAGTLILTTATIPGFIELEASKFETYLTLEGLDQVLRYRREHNETKKPGRERYSKFAKSIIQSGAPDDGYRKPVGFPIEIIPERNPATVRVGDILSVQVLRDGKPAFQLSFEASNETETRVIGRLDSSGRISIPITRAGRWRLHTVAMRRADQTKAIGDASPEAKAQAADWESVWASLTFEIRQ
ncbi:MAG: DUF4198 domain-containing protein [Bryobacteraceae bacterium]